VTTQVIREFKVTSLGLDVRRLDTLWSFVRPADALTHEVWVERSSSPGGPFQLIAKTFNAISFTDRNIFGTAVFARYYYRLKVVSRQAPYPVVETTVPREFTHPKDVLGNEIRRRHNLLLREFIGRPMLYYRLRTDGVRCHDCWGDLENQRVKSHCDTCFDTGFITGFFNPVVLMVNMKDDPDALVQNAEVDEAFVHMGSATMTADIEAFIGDLLVESDNTRWLISSLNHSEKLRSRTIQVLGVAHVQKSDVKYKVPLPEPDILSRIPLSREYARPYTLVPAA